MAQSDTSDGQLPVNVAMPKDEFWTLAIDAHLLRATINWCMVFGSDKEPTHWKRLVRQSENHVRAFCEGLLRKTGLDETGWKDYWDKMVTFRDKWVVHRELEPYREPVPNFNIALATAYHYDDWARDVISPAICEEPPFHLFTESLERSVTPLVDRLLGATNEPTT